MRVLISLYLLFFGVCARELYILDLREGQGGPENYAAKLGFQFVNLLNRTHAVVKKGGKGRGLEKVEHLRKHRFKFKYNTHGYNGLFIISSTVSTDELLLELVKKIPKPEIFRAHPNSGFTLLRLRDPAYLNETIYQLGNLEVVEWFDLYRNMYKNDHFASLVLKTTSPVYNYTGRGQLISIADTGLDFKHCAFSPSDHLKRYTLTDSSFSNLKTTISSFNFLQDKHKVQLYFRISFFDGLHTQETDFGDRKGGHGTHVAGLAAGDDKTCQVELHTPSSSSKILFLDMENSNSTDEHLTTPPLFTPFMTLSYLAGSRIFSNSWGSATCEYTVTAMEFDRFVYFHPDYVILVAAGNSGPGNYTVGSPAVLKNGITVGASQNSHESFLYYAKTNFWDGGRQMLDEGNILTHSYASSNLADFSSRGPTADGRIKPDVLCPGQFSLSSQAHGSWVLMQGTSMATPECARVVAAVIEYLQQVKGVANPRLDLVKGLLVNTAEGLKGGAQHLYLSITSPWLFSKTTKHTLGIYDQGFGLVNFESISSGKSSWLQSEFHSFAPPQKYCFRATSTSPISITLTWIDPPAFVHTDRALINNLNLLVVRNGAAGVYGNHVATPDQVNTVERVRILATEGDEISVHLFTDNTPLHFLKPLSSQPFTLVYSSSLSPYPCTTPCDEWSPPQYISATQVLACNKDTGTRESTSQVLCDLYTVKPNCTCISNRPCMLEGKKGTEHCRYNGTFSPCLPEYSPQLLLSNPPPKARGVRLLLNILESASSNSQLSWGVWLMGVLLVQFYFMLYFLLVK